MWLQQRQTPNRLPSIHMIHKSVGAVDVGMQQLHQASWPAVVNAVLVMLIQKRASIANAKAVEILTT